MSKHEYKKNNINFNKIKKILIVVLILYILLCSAEFFLQDKIIFAKPKLSEYAVTVSAKTNNIENLELKMKDGTKLKGWLLKNSKSEKSNLLIYFGANAEELSCTIPRMSKFKNWSVVLINYRGYGASEGTPGEKELYSDSLDIYDYFSCRNDINKKNIVVMGRSIGTGVATYLASKRSISSVILVSPYETLTSVFKEKCPFLPTDLLLKYKFDSISRAPSIKSPVLIIVGTEDILIPKWHSKKLAEAWGGQVNFEEINGAGHNTVDDGDDYWNKIYEYLTRRKVIEILDTREHWPQNIRDLCNSKAEKSQ